MAYDPAEEIDFRKVLTFSQWALEDVPSYNQMSIAARRLLIPSLEFYISYLLSRQLDDIEQAVRCARQVFDITPPETRWHLARTLVRRFQHTKQAEDITQAIQLLRSVILQTNDIALRQKCLSYLNIAFVERDGNLDGFVELNLPRGIQRFLERNPPRVDGQSKPFLETLTHNLYEDREVLGFFLPSIRLPALLHRSRGLARDLDSEIQVARRALEFAPSVFKATDHILIHLGGLLVIRFTGLVIPRVSGQQGKAEDVTEAIDCFLQAIDMMADFEMVSPNCVLQATYAIFMRHLMLRAQKDLEDAFSWSKLAEDLIDSQNPEFAMILLLQGQIMEARYENSGDVNELNAAIENTSRAIDTSKYDEVLPVMLTALADYLSLRAARSSRAKDVSDAIAAAQKAVDLTPPKSPPLISYLVNLSRYELEQYIMLQDEESLERSLRHRQEAAHIAKENPELMHVTIFPGLDRILARWNERSLGETELDKEITTLRNGTTSFLAIGVDTKLFLSDALFRRWVRTGNKGDIDEAISIDRQVIELGEITPQLSVMVRWSLGRSLYNQYRETGRTNSNEDLRQALMVLLEAFRMPAGTSSVRIDAGALAIEILCRLRDWIGARKLSLEILDLFVILNGRVLNWEDQQFWLRQFSNVAQDYAAIAFEAGCNLLDVVDTLETCRGAILGHQIEIKDLEKVAPDKARQFKALHKEMDVSIDLSGTKEPGVRAAQVARRIQVEAEIRACLAEIRSLEGFQKFLLGPTEEALKAAAAAARGAIVIVNITRIRSDAIIITKDISALRLPGLLYHKVEEYIHADLTNFCPRDVGKKNRKYRQLQTWLWDNCVKLILERLDSLTGAPPKHRVCWIGIGVASSLPFHAAGIYTETNKRGINKETALSRIISTYTSTLKFLIDGQRQVRTDSSKQKLQRLTSTLHAQSSQAQLAVVSMPSTPGMLDLEGVEREAEEVLKIAGDTFSTRLLIQPSAKDAMAHMAECEVVHFACHGASTLPDVSNSHLLLQTTTPDSTVPMVDKLTLKDVATSKLSCGKLAFLSACSTAESRSSKLRDEALHLVSGFQVAGFLHAIGNLWPSDDEVSVEVVKGFYKHLVAAGEFGNGDNVAEALNEALCDIASEYALQPLCWAQFVHFGI